MPHQPNSQWLSYLPVADVDSAAEHTRAAGGAVLLAPFDMPKIGRGAIVIDPQGAPLGLLRAFFGDPAVTPEPVMHRFLWTEELARDPVAAAQFHADLVGYEVLVHDQADKPFRVLKRGRERAGSMRMPFANMQPIWLPSVMVADPSAGAQRAQQLGGRILVTPRMDVRSGSVAPDRRPWRRPSGLAAVAVLIRRIPSEIVMPTKLPRLFVLALAVAASLLVGGCDEGVQVGGVGASVGLPSAFTSSAPDPTDIGVGNVHWVGNPRW